MKKSIASLFMVILMTVVLIQGCSSEQEVEYKTEQGGTLSVVLPDSSEVQLNENSSLVFTMSADGKERKAQLSGEAIFEVEGIEGGTFVVNTDNSKTTVVGTSFRVKENEDEAEVEVYEGEVEFSDQDNSESSRKRVGKKEKARYDKKKKNTSKKKSSGKKPKWVKKVGNSQPVKNLKKEGKRAFKEWKKEL